MISHDEQRSYYRMMINAECIVVVNNAQAPQQYNAVCRDLSASGMAVELEQALNIGESVSIRINSTNVQIPSLTAKGKVLRCNQETGDTFIVGIEVVELA